ncbi:hypothetical protein OIU85_006393 [Salix viminalis]|uniref:Uncharacterized protein n=1 Tax=Salix viminalis TaxID=40686 RepID=A0A9Q0SV11_SALVM|nr:hypothetical protein OIU85_006393 [Salix viminalis]
MLQSNSTHHQTPPGVAHSSPRSRRFHSPTLRLQSRGSQQRTGLCAAAAAGGGGGGGEEEGGGGDKFEDL